MTDRVTKTSVGKWDQVIAVTQYMINAGVKNLWKEHEDDKQMKEGYTLNIGDWTGAIENAFMEAPVIQVKWEPGSQNQLLYSMKFKSGKMKIQTATVKRGAAPQYTECDLAGWNLMIPVELTYDTLKPDDPVYIKKLASQPPGQYSVTRLLVTIKAGVSRIDFERSTLVGIDWKKDWNENVRNRCSDILNNILEDLFTYALDTVGYAVKNENVDLLKKEHKATFTPTALRFQTYPWAENGKPAEPGLTGNARLNYLCYLEMTEGHPLPDAKDLTLVPTGNWTDGRLDQGSNPSSMDFGNFAMSKQTFLQGYIFKRLRKINRAMEPRVKDMHNKLWWVTEPFTYKYSWDCDCRVGYNSDHPNADDDYFDFKATTNPTEWKFSSTYNSDQPGMSNMWDHQDLGWSVETWGQIGCDCENILSWTPGSDEINIKGKSHVMLYYSNKNLTTDDDTLNFTATWSMKLKLQSVSDGGLQIAVTADKPISTANFDLKQKTLSSYGTYLKGCYDIALANLSTLQQDLINDIAGTEKFYFPASGTFFFKNPMLNHEGALLCAIGYNGADDFRNPDTTKERTIVQPQPDLPQPTQPGASHGDGNAPKKQDEPASGGK